MFKNVIARFRHKKIEEITVSIEVLRSVYKILHSVRKDLVESFYHIKDRKLREVYDYFAFMMLKYDKTLQFLRRALNEDLYTAYPRLTPQELEKELAILPMEMASTMRSLVQMAKLLKEFSIAASPPYINSAIKQLENIVEDIAKYLDRAIS
uniref:Uncharacterized protein n=1 Tax=Ignisphaera aggregans TaxID=334771 RepID=A0A7C2VHI0_9CREN